MLETMHDGLRMAMSGLRTNVQDGTTCYELDVLIQMCHKYKLRGCCKLQLSRIVTSCLAALTEDFQTVR